ncbi:MAG TPA: TatD family hydrolase [Jatrophihabitans sp.]
MPDYPIERLDVPVFDAHTHLDYVVRTMRTTPSGGGDDVVVETEPTDTFVAGVLAAAREVGVVAAVTVGTSVEESAWCVAAAQRHDGLYAAVGVHPTEVRGLTDADYAALEALARNDRVVAVGETGLDYHWDDTTPAEQDEHFRRHIALAKAVDKPLMIHDREAHADVLRILREEGAPDQVVFHSFSGDEAMARECVAAGYVLSFSGVVSFKNAPDLRAAAAVTPLELMLVETDAPYLTPHPYRGRPNAPRLLPLTVRALAAAAGQSPDELAAAVLDNGHRLFAMSDLPRY